MSLRRVALFAVVALASVSLAGCVGGAPISDDCVASWKATNDVANASDEVYDEAALATLDECKDVADWLAGGNRYPLAAGWTEANDERLFMTLNTLCVRRIKSAVCQDAATLGKLDFDPNDPGLDDLQE